MAKSRKPRADAQGRVPLRFDDSCDDIEAIRKALGDTRTIAEFERDCRELGERIEAKRRAGNPYAWCGTGEILKRFTRDN